MFIVQDEEITTIGTIKKFANFIWSKSTLDGSIIRYRDQSLDLNKNIGDDCFGKFSPTFVIEDPKSSTYVGHNGRLWDCTECPGKGWTNRQSFLEYHKKFDGDHKWFGVQGLSGVSRDWGRSKTNYGYPWAAPLGIVNSIMIDTSGQCLFEKHQPV